MTTRREKWFAAGANALHRTLVAHGLAGEILDLLPADGAYACPCCLIAYKRTALDDGPEPTLSDEHVPPAATGGEPLLLTCRPCNNRAGTVWDADAAEERQLTNALTRQPSDPVDVTLTIGNIRVQGAYDGNGDLPSFTPAMKKNANRPGDVNAVAAHLARSIENKDPVDFNVTHRWRPTADAAAWSWIRAAYLAAFAVLGYRYVLLAVLAPLRTRLADPQPVPAPKLLIPTGRPQLDRPLMMLVEQPAALPCLMVDFGHAWVFLPGWRNPQTITGIEQALQGMIDAGDRVRGRLIPWPEEPLYRLDPKE
ncbi:hypothetical protein FHR83_005518 [Actinoplanes campanulatus]|uniref:HNH endonuclease n=1 Tax=Actinoplanes campanulatus TaxID=113559 RepID=A0A7W5AL23_9ACTN|nr:hypothetical protein [Actinoplanes campanulatus]MBB3097834.1 hypothetical protein [Actinoplanes campanulatus]GGN38546.1 hypothetical protein GCM10010109_65560 [Actinoplanes campanulatus]GID39598.1 hypothetical protein Aca09nite_61040 [Actinoplanes campanulatus]